MAAGRGSRLPKMVWGEQGDRDNYCTLVETNYPQEYPKIEQCMNMMSGGMMVGMMLPMLLGMLLVGALIVAGIVFLIRHFSTAGSGTNSAALKILQERYARGELDHEDYQERRQRLLETQA